MRNETTYATDALTIALAIATFAFAVVTLPIHIEHLFPGYQLFGPSIGFWSPENVSFLHSVVAIVGFATLLLATLSLVSLVFPPWRWIVLFIVAMGLGWMVAKMLTPAYPVSTFPNEMSGCLLYTSPSPRDA